MQIQYSVEEMAVEEMVIFEKKSINTKIDT